MLDKPHDALVKAIFSRVVHAAELFRTGLPAELAQHIEFDTLSPRSASFIDDRLRESSTDLLFAVSCAGQEILLLLEHLSNVQHRAVLRLWCYVGDASTDVLARNPAMKSSPLVIPYVLHHSEKGWTAPRSMRELVEHETAVHAALRPFVPGFEFVLDDLAIQSDEELRSRSMSAVPRLALWALRSARNASVLKATIHGWVEVFREALDSWDEFILILRYTLEVSDVETDYFKTFLAREVGPRASEAYMTIGERLRNEGRAEGRSEGRSEGRNEGRAESARNLLTMLLRQRFGEVPEELRHRIAQAQADKLEQWFQRALVAQAVNEVFRADNTDARDETGA